LKCLYHKIEENEISLEIVKEQLFEKRNVVSWHEKDWSERRKNFLKSKCEQCGIF